MQYLMEERKERVRELSKIASFRKDLEFLSPASEILFQDVLKESTLLCF